MSAWKEAREFYKQKKAEEKLKKKLLSTKSDWHLLEQLIQKVNENPDLRIDIHLSDGTLINMKCYQKKETHDLINGNIYEVR
jgi:type IV secretory pathway component VirB8